VPPAPPAPPPFTLQDAGQIAAIILAVCAIVALVQIILLKRQLDLMEQDLKTRNLRASREAALKYGEWFTKEVLSRGSIFFASADAANLKLKEPFTIGNFSKESLTPEQYAAAKKRKALNGWYELTCVMEVVAAGFTSGVADDETGYIMMGRAYYGMVWVLYDTYVVLIEEEGRPSCAVTLQLFERWKAKMSAEDLDHASEALQRQREDLFRRRQAIKLADLTAPGSIP
jgi:hypothetical protein